MIHYRIVGVTPEGVVNQYGEAYYVNKKSVQSDLDHARKTFTDDTFKVFTREVSEWVEIPDTRECGFMGCGRIECGTECKGITQEL